MRVGRVSRKRRTSEGGRRAVLPKTCGIGQALEEIDEAVDLRHNKQHDTFLCMNP